MTSSLLPREWGRGKLIGSGSFGEVHIAMDKINGHLFVVKSSRFNVGVKFLENEAHVLSKLKSSPYVVQYLGKEITCAPNNEPILNIFIEYMGGGTLFDVIDKFGGKLSEGVIRSYTRQLLLGLNYLHENRIVHCDIKCKNILLDSHGNVKLADFGCATTLTNDFSDKGTNSKVLPQKQHIGGTPLWMAPEVLKGKSPNKASDIWSLGCVIIEMATGKPPNWGKNMTNPMATILKIVTNNENPPFPNELSHEGLNFLEICFQRDPEKRLTSKELLQHPFILSNHTINKNLVNRHDVHSPSSVLDIGKFDMNFSDDEEEDDKESQNRGVHNVIPSHIGLILKTHRVMRNNFQVGFVKPQIDLKISEKWVTVRSIG